MAHPMIMERDDFRSGLALALASPRILVDLLADEGGQTAGRRPPRLNRIMRFETIVTDRLLIREFRESDEADLLARRNDPKVAKFQNWELPVTPEQAHDMAVSLARMEGPEDDEWYMPIVVDKETGVTLGELALHCQSDMRTAEVGYTFASEHWGNGYAVEALGALVAWLFEAVGVTRVFGMLHPENVASAQVLERTGFL
ncbi:MAG: GNAT family N-acetyltransferase, partial [Acidimicrobiia bacterium]|nr:GNAT family N-acetyltransferase [Acidimicrobiia bacterium]